jgi:hypothetical protein
MGGCLCCCRCFSSCHPSPQAEDLLLSLFSFILHQRIVISTQAAHALSERRSGETPAFAFVFAFALVVAAVNIPARQVRRKNQCKQ